MKIIDCTIRDGGLMNKWQFDQPMVAAVVEASVGAGVDYIEIGYKASAEYFDPAEYGIWRFSPEAALREVWGNEKVRNRSRLAIMIDIGRFKLEELCPAADSVVSMFRVACYVHQIDEAIATSQHLHQLGYQTTLNIMAVSEADENELEAGLQRIAQNSPALAIYVVDSYGSLSPAACMGLVHHYQRLCPGKAIGFHGHNNQQLALANSLAAMEAGAAFVDASLLGMGRGAGNCHLELLMSQLGANLTQVQGLLRAAELHIAPLQPSLKWGYSLPYALAGMANQHPRRAMAIMDRGESLHESGYLDELLDKVISA
jgi:4-hydroxy 2-oxovalerate aldolase